MRISDWSSDVCSSDLVFPDLVEKSGFCIGQTGKGWDPGDYKASGRQRNPAGPLFSGKTLKSPEGISNVDYAGNFARFLSERPDDRPFFFWLGTHEPHRRFKKGIGLERGMDPAQADVPAFLPDVEEVRNDLLDYGVEIQWFDNQLGQALALLEKIGRAHV